MIICCVLPQLFEARRFRWWLSRFPATRQRWVRTQEQQRRRLEVPNPRLRDVVLAPPPLESLLKRNLGPLVEDNLAARVRRRWIGQARLHDWAPRDSRQQLGMLAHRVRDLSKDAPSRCPSRAQLDPSSRPKCRT